MKNKAVIYARYSSHNQREESIEGQLRECYDYAHKNDLLVIKEYCDRGISGKTDERPEFQQLIEDSNKKEFDVVLMYTLDRFARNRYDSAIYKNKLKKNGVKVVYVKQPMPDTPEGIILESVLEGYAEYYSENLARNVKRGMLENANKGVYNGGRVPLGYDIVNKEYVINQEEAKLVVEIFNLFNDNKSFKEMADILNEEGHRTKDGLKFYSNSFPTVLRNKLYIGTYRFSEVEIPDRVPAIISKDLFEVVQRKLEINKKIRARKKAKEIYLLTGKLFCGECGELMIGDSAYGRKHFYCYYACKNRKAKKCTKKSVRKEVIEPYVLNYIKTEVLSDENIEKLIDEVYTHAKAENDKNYDLKSLQSKLRETDKQIKNLVDSVSHGLTSKTIVEKINELEELRDQLSIQVEKAKEYSQLTREHISFYLHYLKEDDSVEDHNQKLIDIFVQKIYLYDNKIVMIFNITGEKEEKEFNVSDTTHPWPPFLLNTKLYSQKQLICIEKI